MFTFMQFVESTNQTKMPEPKTDEKGKPKVMSGSETAQHFPKAAMDAMRKHPLFQRHIASARQVGFAHDVDKMGEGGKHDVHKIIAVTGDNGSGIRHKIEFHMSHSGRKVDTTKRYTNTDNERYPSGHPLAGSPVWKQHSD